LADTIDYLVARTTATTPRRDGPSAASWRAPRTAQSRLAESSHEVRLIVDRDMRIAEVSSVACGGGAERPLCVAVERRGDAVVLVTLSRDASPV
jgi:hypothetical protein